MSPKISNYYHYLTSTAYRIGPYEKTAMKVYSMRIFLLKTFK